MINEAYTISTDKSLLDFSMIFNYLSKESYWAKGISENVVRRSIEHSLCFGVYIENKQVGFARIISDFATYAYLADVFLLQDYRGKGLSKRLMETIMAHHDLQGLRRWVLATADAHGLYARYGFMPIAKPERWMEKHNPTVYQK
ncbi:MAG: GNAT family N-acetyltransferase [Bacteroidetes bacterium]|nr:GNAT family N-acetyltransferase [Bacteroidota bacterium]